VIYNLTLDHTSMFYEDLLDKVCFELGYQSFESYKLIVEPPKPEDITPGYIMGIWTDLCYRAYDSNCHNAVMCIDALIYAALGIPISTGGDRIHPKRVVAYEYDYAYFINDFRVGGDFTPRTISESPYETTWILFGDRDTPFDVKYGRWVAKLWKLRRIYLTPREDLHSFLEHKVSHYKALADPTRYMEFANGENYVAIGYHDEKPNKDRTSMGVVRFYLRNLFTGNLDASHKYYPSRAFNSRQEMPSFHNGMLGWNATLPLTTTTDEERNQTEAEFKASLERG
jgi:hypothetical protein